MEKIPKQKSVERKIYFYKATCVCDGKPQKLNGVFDSYINKLNKDNTKLIDRSLALPYFEKYHFLDVKRHDIDADTYFGQFYSLRGSDFPYLFNMLSGDRQEISSNADDTLMEQTHFLCFTNRNLIVSEFNFHGARIEKLGDYLRKIMQEIHPSKSYYIEILPIIIPDYYEKIANCKSISKLQFKVAQPGLKLLKEYGVINAYDVASGNISSDSSFYMDIELSGGKRGATIPINNLPNFLKKIINMIKISQEDETVAESKRDPVFSKAKMRGYDSAAGKTIPYDLLDEKLLQTAWVEKISARTKYVDSDKMFLAMQQSFRDQHDYVFKYMRALDE